MDLFCALLGLLGVFLAIILFVKHKHSYWKRLGIPYVQPHPVFGNVKEMITTEHSSITMQRCYNQMKGKGIIGGIYMFYNPLAIVLKPDLIKHILIKDFNNFNHRGVYHNQKDDPISGHLFALEGEQWKNLRSKLSPTFTSGKLKMMFETILKVTQEFTEYVSEYAVTGANIEMKDILARYTTDIIGTCAFGLECNSLRNPDSEFRRIGKRALELEPLEALKVFVVSSMPAGLAHKLGLITTPKEVSKFFLGTIHETIDYREKNKVERNDFMNLLIQLKNHGKLTDEDKDLGKITLDEIAAQCFVFFLAGFETSSSTMTFCLFELAQNASIQERLREEIKGVIAKHDNQLTYEAAMEMPYLDQVINETLRKYPPVDTLMRATENDYNIPDSDITIRKGITVFIPVYSMHHDPEYYENPEEFNPERFTSENVTKRHPYTFLPFGDGPRNCIGMRFGMLQTRMGLIALLRNFRFSTSSKTQIPIVFKAGVPTVTPNSGVWLKVEKIK